MIRSLVATLAVGAIVTAGAQMRPGPAGTAPKPREPNHHRRSLLESG